MIAAYTPFPRYENIVIVGDTAAEALAHLHVWGRALVGGDVPGMETLHPCEKMLECTYCALHDRKRILDAALRRIGAESVLLEENGVPGLDPVVMKADLEKEGFRVQTLDVRGTPEEVLRRAGALTGETRQAERVLREGAERMKALEARPALPALRVLPLLGIRHPVRDETYGFVACADSDLALEVLRPLGLVHAAPELASDALPGVADLAPERLAEVLGETKPDVIALCGDASAAASVLLAARQEAFPPALPLPWYCRPLMWRLPRILEVWHGTLSALRA